MLTQKYNKKIDKFIAIYKFAYRYRVLLCSLAIISALTSATLMGLVGTIIDDITPEKFTYGDNFELEASSLFNDKPKIQYSSSGANNWGYDKPILVGKYDARTVSKNVFGGDRYGKIHTFEIVPREIKPTVDGGSFQYGSNPDLEFTNLKEGDKLVYRNYKLNSVNTDPNLSFVDGDFLIVNEEGENVTSNYKIDYTPVGVSLMQKEVDLSISAVKTYDGEPLYANNENVFTTDDLVKGDHIEVVGSNKLTNVGTINANANLKAVSDTFGDVTSLYKFDVKSSSLTVNKRSVSLKINDYEKEYDGKATNIDASYCKITEGALVEGHNLEITFNQYIDAGEYEITPYSIKVIDEEGVDVTQNYNFNITSGICRVLKRNITISTPYSSFIYDGSVHGINEFSLNEETPLAEGENIIIKNEYYTDASNVGSYENKVELDIVNSDEKSTIKNYDITYKYGSIEITKKDIVVSSPDMTGDYNGNQLPFFDVSNNITYNQADLGAGDTLQVQSQEDFRYATPGVYENTFSVSILNSSKKDVSNNYNIIYKPGKVTINKREISCTTASSTFYYYEGGKYSFGSFNSTNNLASGDELIGVDYTVVTEKGIFDNEMTPVITNDQGADVTSAYKINMSLGKLEVIDDPNDEQEDVEAPVDGSDSDTSSGGQQVADSGVILIDKKPNEGGESGGEEGGETGGEEGGETGGEEGGESGEDPDPGEDPDNPGSEEDNPGEDTKPNYLYKFTTNENRDHYYFRQNVYGKYSDGKLYYAPTYDISRLSVASNPDLYLSKLVRGKKTSNEININYNALFKKDIAPYYVNQFPMRQNYEGKFDYSGWTSNSFETFNYNFLEEGFGPINIDNMEYNENVESYENFVKNNYLYVPDNLNAPIDQIIDEYNLVADNEFDTIYNIARYMSKHNTISTEPLYEIGDDPVYKMLTETHSGKSSHFAITYAMMLRKVGVPARVASGYIAQGLKGNENEVYKGACESTWTEVYSSDLKCWVYVDTFPTYAIEYKPEPVIPEEPEEPEEPDNPGGEEGGETGGEGGESGESPNPGEDPDKPGGEDPDKPGEGDEEDKPEEFPRDPIKGSLTIKSPDIFFTYNGKANKCDNDNFTYFGDALLDYDEIQVEYIRSAIDVVDPSINPSIQNEFVYRIVDTRNGKDVTKEYEGRVLTIFGNLFVERAQLDVISADLSKAYDGTRLMGTIDCISFGENGLQGDDKITGVIFTSFISEVGTVKNKFEITRISRFGYDNCLNNYEINPTYGNLTIY